LKRFCPFFFSAAFFLIAIFSRAAPGPTPSPSTVPSYREIPYYLKQLEATTQEDKRIEFDKAIHDAVVNAGLGDKKVVAEMTPMIEKIQIAMDSKLDRMNVTGQAMWLASAVDYFEQEKLRPVIDVPEGDWLGLQSETKTGLKLLTDPNKIVLNTGTSLVPLVEKTNIHEAVISPDQKQVAFSRVTDDNSRAEIWITSIKNKKSRKVTTAHSCYTLIFSLDGSDLYFQEMPPAGNKDAMIYVVDAGGGKPRALSKGRLLQTIVSKGPYKGALVVFRGIKHHLGVSEQDCAVLVDSKSGKEIGRLKNGPCR
jgi:hypothetical protein